jgi:hypothetical protein
MDLPVELFTVWGVEFRCWMPIVAGVTVVAYILYRLGDLH